MATLLLLSLPLNYKTKYPKSPIPFTTPPKELIIFSAYSSNPKPLSPSTNTKFRQYPLSSLKSANTHKILYTKTSYINSGRPLLNLSLKRSVLDKLRDKGSDPLQILDDDGDWSKEIFWGVVRFLKQVSRSKDILQVFNLWKSKEVSRINELNFEKIIWLLIEEGFVEDAVSAFGDMKKCGISPTLEIYYSVIHGLTRKGWFEDALVYLREMVELDLKPESDIFDSFIKAYGKYKKYDEMGLCVELMQSAGCLPDYVTYNLLIREFARAGLLKKMERTYQIIVSKRMDLQPLTLISMLEAYTNFGIFDKMEKFLKKALKSRTHLDDNLIRKIAGIYIDNSMFSRVENLGVELSSKVGKTDLVWCLRMLSHACVLSKKGMDSIVLEMEADGLPWNATVANILLLAYLKMRDFTHLNFVLSELLARYVKPDIVTFGALFDAYKYGFDRPYVMNIWRRMGYLEESVEMNTDALVLASFGKGHFLKTVEEAYASLESNPVKVQNYHHLINLVKKSTKS